MKYTSVSKTEIKESTFNKREMLLQYQPGQKIHFLTCSCLSIR